MASLNPPRINTTDPNQQDLSDNSDDHFSSASEGTQSPVPITRVERVDDTPAHGEVPGTPAYHLRTQDAVPDEIEIVPEGRRSRSSTAVGRGRASSALTGTGSGAGSRPQTPGGSPIPKTVVEKVDFKPSHGEVEGTPAREMRMADAMPDEIRAAPAETGQRLEGRRHQHEVDSGPADETEEGRQAWFRSMWESDVSGKPTDNEEEEEDHPVEHDADQGNDHDDDDGFGDDFDDFAEGEGDADFGDFDEAESIPSQTQETQQPRSNIPPAPDILADLPPLDLSDPSTIQAYIRTLIPPTTPPTPPPEGNSIPKPQMFLSERSLSLWQQLVSPPPMQPPNWTRSRIRRLFLVSLGVPVDLDEILPPSKQKRLVLPNVGFGDDTSSPRPSTAIDRLKDNDAAASTTSLDSKTGVPRPSKRTRGAAIKGPPVPPDFDANAAALLAATTFAALGVMDDAELTNHVKILGEENEKASRVLEFWLQRRDEGLKEKEALEGVIENLVGFVKGRRKG